MVLGSQVKMGGVAWELLSFNQKPVAVVVSPIETASWKGKEGSN